MNKLQYFFQFLKQILPIFLKFENIPIFPYKYQVFFFCLKFIFLQHNMLPRSKNHFVGFRRQEKQLFVAQRFSFTESNPKICFISTEHLSSQIYKWVFLLLKQNSLLLLHFRFICDTTNTEAVKTTFPFLFIRSLQQPKHDESTVNGKTLFHSASRQAFVFSRK